VGYLTVRTVVGPLLLLVVVRHESWLAHTGSEVDYIAVAAVAASCSWADHTVLPGRGRAEVRLGGLARTCCRGFAEPAGSVPRRIGSFACLHMRHVGLPALVAAAQPLAAAAVVAACSCPRIAVVPEHPVPAIGLSWT
jgi:hypothetical protein